MQTLVLSILLIASTTAGRLPAPTTNEMVISDRPGVIIKWELVTRNLEPVLGYKVRVWEPKKMKKIYLKTVNGKRTLVDELITPELADFTIRDGQLHEYTPTGADHSQLIINDIKKGTPYLFQVLAFGASGDGEPSSPFGVKLQVKNSTVTAT